MGQFKSVRQSRVSEAILAQLKEAILLEHFKSGEKLPSERELTEEFQVSRGVIREAIRVLEITGFVVLRQGPTGVCTGNNFLPSRPGSILKKSVGLPPRQLSMGCHGIWLNRVR